MGMIRLIFLAAGSVLTLAAQVSVLTYQYDLARDGANSHEIALTPANVNVNQFGALFSYPVDGSVYAQPLYVPNVSIAGRGSHNVVYVATEHDSVYAFDADGPGSPAAGPLWQVSFLNANAGVTAVPAADTGCTQIVPEIGITGTPVIDPQTGTLFVVAMTKETGSGGANYVQRLHALDLTSGAERPGSPVVIQASSPGSGDGGMTDVLQPKSYKQRPGLLLLNGTVYAGFSSHCDIGQYHGWLIGYDENTLQQTTVYNDTPNGNEGSFWASGAAPAADADGNIYVVSGNGTTDAPSGGPDLGESYIKLATSGGLSASDSFTPFNFQSLNNGDVDTGSAGVALLGDEAGSPAHPHLMAGAGKEGRIYLLDRDHLGGWQAGGDNQIVQSLPGAISPLFGNPAYFNQTLYFCGSGDGVFAFPIANAQMAAAPSSRSPTPFGYPGCVPGISANGAGSAIVWALESSATLHAYDAANLGSELYNSSQNPARDNLGSYVKFSAPTVANGKVYAGTQNALVVYGLLAGGAPLAASNSADGDPNAVAPGSIVSIYGQGLSQATAIASHYPLPDATLGGASVTMNGWPAPIFYASPVQLNVEVPLEVSPGPVTINVFVNGAPGNQGSLNVRALGPSLFQFQPGRAAALNADQSINSSTQPDAPGSLLYLFATGLGPVNPAVATGAPAGSNPPSGATNRVAVTIGGQAAAVQYAGIIPGYTGLYQLQVIVPNVAPGDHSVQVLVAGTGSNVASVSVR